MSLLRSWEELPAESALAARPEKDGHHAREGVIVMKLRGGARIWRRPSIYSIQRPPSAYRFARTEHCKGA
jgi:hypothetical protein